MTGLVPQLMNNAVLEAMSKVLGVKVKWLSVEPLLEPLKFESLKGIDMIVIGAQSVGGPKR